jgi:divalent metal cation (Fe/Co/Zn/Cd) transporter
VGPGVLHFGVRGWYRIRLGRQIGSAALIADGLHARTDGFTSLAVVADAVGVLLGFPLADPIVGILITVAILFVLRGAETDSYRRLMEASTPPRRGRRAGTSRPPASSRSRRCACAAEPSCLT